MLNTHQHCQTTNVSLPAGESVTEAKAAAAFTSVTDIIHVDMRTLIIII